MLIMDDKRTQSGRLSRYSCATCRHQKKKCDRRQPQCSLCQRYDRVCVYRNTRKSSVLGTSPESLSGAPPTTTAKGLPDQNGFPAVYFTDSALFWRSVGSLPDANLSISPDLLSLVEDVTEVREFTEAFFRYNYPWAPFICRRNFLERILNPLGERRCENVLLIAAIKLITTEPDTGASSATYRSLKRALLEVELSGNLTFRTLQALVLVAIYELGQAIYPSAYLTVGYCARYGIALGIDRTIDSFYSSKLDDSEEERRTWWTIILLDRYLNVGCPERALLIKEPSNTSVLPMDDKLWEMGYPPPDPPLVISSPPTEAMGRFCLTVQAAYLLGKVLRYTGPQASGHRILEHEAQILDSTIAALTKVTLQEGAKRGIEVCCPTTICHSARLILNQEIAWINRHKSPVETNSVVEVQITTAADMLTLSRYILRTGLSGNVDISPFCHDAFYRSAIVYSQILQKGDSEDAKNALHDIKQSLRVNNHRWKAAATYLRLLDARDVTGIF
ncbi:fungal-specific transcription factor domain-containing protein [Trichoderma sp. SZMC 28013]